MQSVCQLPRLQSNANMTDTLAAGMVIQGEQGVSADRVVVDSPPIDSEHDLAAVCVALDAQRVRGWSPAEDALVAAAQAHPAPDRARLAAIRDAMRAGAAGADILGDAFCALRSAAARRPRGATYTPPAIVDAMVQWAAADTAFAPARVIDPGTGSARFLVAAAAAFPRARLIGVELDPLAALVARANLAARGLADRARVVVADYRGQWQDPRHDPDQGPTLFIGNPPYVRHHGIDKAWKRWLAQRAAAHGLRASQLAGLHMHFLVATLERARPGDAGAFVTAAEWLDVNYGQVARDLFAGPLGCTRLDLLAPEARAFADAQTTAVIACFRVGAAAPSVHVRRVATIDALAPLAGGRLVSRQGLAHAPRWTQLAHAPLPATAGLIALGELCRVHRGQVTGKNQLWIAGQATPPLPPPVLFPAITRARELLAAGAVLTDHAALRRVIDLPPDLQRLAAADRALVERFLAWARERGAHASYIARHRSPWWSVRLREPPPILATYMARRPPAFVRNRAGARFINIAHGLYPRQPLSEACLDALAAYLSRSVSPGQGRTYAGGLTKFEPREMERLLVPTPDALIQHPA